MDKTTLNGTSAERVRKSLFFLNIRGRRRGLLCKRRLKKCGRHETDARAATTFRPRLPKLSNAISAAVLAAVIAPPLAGKAEPMAPRAAEILVLGDSQISYGAGPALLSLFKNLPSHCQGIWSDPEKTRKKLGAGRVAILAVTATAPHHWTSRAAAEKRLFCELPIRDTLNATILGELGTSSPQHVRFQDLAAPGFCVGPDNAFEATLAMFERPPRLIVPLFLGNAALRWEKDRSIAAADARALLAQWPEGAACLFATTMPVYLERSNLIREVAQETFFEAMRQEAPHCVLLKGVNSHLRRKIEGAPKYFRTNESGNVVDVYHPKPAAAEIFAEHQTPDICLAVENALKLKLAPPKKKQK